MLENEVQELVEDYRNRLVRQHAADTASMDKRKRREDEGEDADEDRLVIFATNILDSTRGQSGSSCRNDSQYAIASSSRGNNRGICSAGLLPEEVWQHVLLLLPPASILSLAATCRQFLEIALADAVWESVSERDWGKQAARGAASAVFPLQRTPIVSPPPPLSPSPPPPPQQEQPQPDLQEQKAQPTLQAVLAGRWYSLYRSVSALDGLAWRGVKERGEKRPVGRASHGMAQVGWGSVDAGSAVRGIEPPPPPPASAAEAATATAEATEAAAAAAAAAAAEAPVVMFGGGCSGGQHLSDTWLLHPLLQSPFSLPPPLPPPLPHPQPPRTSILSPSDPPPPASRPPPVPFSSPGVTWQPLSGPACQAAEVVEAGRAGGGVDGGMVVMFGGINDLGQRLDDTWLFGPKLREAAHVVPPGFTPAAPRGAGAAAAGAAGTPATGSHGGSNPAAGISVKQQNDWQWQQLHPAVSPPARGAHAGTHMGGQRVVVFGGIDSAGRRLSDAWLLDLAEEPITWRQLEMVGGEERGDGGVGRGGGSGVEGAGGDVGTSGAEARDGGGDGGDGGGGDGASVAVAGDADAGGSRGAMGAEAAVTTSGTDTSSRNRNRNRNSSRYGSSSSSSGSRNRSRRGRHELPCARSGHSLTGVCDGTTVLIGGRGAGMEVLSDVWIMQLQGDTVARWISLEWEEDYKGDGGCGRAGVGRASGGEGIERTEGTERMEGMEGMGGMEGTEGEGLVGPGPRAGHSATRLVDGRVVLFGGEGENRGRRNDLWVLDVRGRVRALGWCGGRRDGVVCSGVCGGVRGGVCGGVRGGVCGGVHGGVCGGVRGGVCGGVCGAVSERQAVGLLEGEGRRANGRLVGAEPRERGEQESERLGGRGLGGDYYVEGLRECALRGGGARSGGGPAEEAGGCIDDRGREGGESSGMETRRGQVAGGTGAGGGGTQERGGDRREDRGGERREEGERGGERGGRGGERGGGGGKEIQVVPTGAEGGCEWKPKAVPEAGHAAVRRAAEAAQNAQVVMQQRGAGQTQQHILTAALPCLRVPTDRILPVAPAVAPTLAQPAAAASAATAPSAAAPPPPAAAAATARGTSNPPVPPLSLPVPQPALKQVPKRHPYWHQVRALGVAPAARAYHGACAVAGGTAVLVYGGMVDRTSPVGGEARAGGYGAAVVVQSGSRKNAAGAAAAAAAASASGAAAGPAAAAAGGAAASAAAHSPARAPAAPAARSGGVQFDDSLHVLYVVPPCVPPTPP
ncbi:unnamed protein product [Closterium sp. NIES-54]